MKAFTLLKIWLILLAISFQAKSASREEINFFETKIRPILVQNCYKCHSKDSEKVKGGLLLDNAANTQKGGDSGPAVVPNDLDKSLLYKSIAYKDKDLQMPPSGKLSESVIKDFETWIKMGAPDPRSGTVQSASGKLDEIVKNHWSYQPIKKPIVPTNSLKWGNNEIDAFILKKQLENKLSPSLEADKKTLIRRVYYDLIGLPPTLKEVEDFINDNSKNAYEKIINNEFKVAPQAAKYPKTLKGGSFLDAAASLRSSKRIHSDPIWNRRDPQIPKSKWWLTEAKQVGIRLVRPLKEPNEQEVQAFFKSYLN